MIQTIIITSIITFLIVIIPLLYIIRNNNIIHKNQMNQVLLSIPTMRIDDRLRYTQELLSFIDELISIEIINEKRFDIFLDIKNKNLNVDEVIEIVSSNVFNSLTNDIFINKDNILTEKYLMSYIQKKTFISYLTYIKNNMADQF